MKERHRYSLSRRVALSSWGLLHLLTHSLVASAINHRIPPSNAEGLWLRHFHPPSDFATRPTFLGHVLILSPHYLLCVASGSFPRNFMCICWLQVRPVDFIAPIISGDTQRACCGFLQRNNVSSDMWFRRNVTNDYKYAWVPCGNNCRGPFLSVLYKLTSDA
jgi:hypothetical protein